MKNFTVKPCNICLIGHENVGKSTIFNWLTKSKSIVTKVPGTTRDLKSANFILNNHLVTLTDSPGIKTTKTQDYYNQVNQKVVKLMSSSDIVILVIKATDQLSNWENKLINQYKRKTNLVIVVTHGDVAGNNPSHNPKDYQGIKSAYTNLYNLSPIMNLIAPMLSWFNESYLGDNASEENTDDIPKVAVIGRTNVGKSSLINNIVKENRLLTSNKPGTTTDSISLKLSFDGHDFAIIDTSGIRRKHSIKDDVEEIAIIKTLALLKDVCCLVVVLDGSEGLTQQDLFIIKRSSIQLRKPLILVINKVDTPQFKVNSADFIDNLKTNLSRYLTQRIILCSAITGRGINSLLTNITQVIIQKIETIPKAKKTTRYLTRYLQEFTTKLGKRHIFQGCNLKLAMMAPNSSAQDIKIIVFGRGVLSINAKNYLQNSYNDLLGLKDIPIKVIFKPVVNNDKY